MFFSFPIKNLIIIFCLRDNDKVWTRIFDCDNKLMKLLRHTLCSNNYPQIIAVLSATGIVFYSYDTWLGDSRNVGINGSKYMVKTYWKLWPINFHSYFEGISSGFYCIYSIHILIDNISGNSLTHDQ